MAPSVPGLPSEPQFIVCTDEEREAGRWSRANLQRALEAFHRDGLIVMENIVDKEELLKLKEAMLKTSAEVKALKTHPTQYNHGIMSNFLQAPPLSTPELLFPDVYQNPFVKQVAEKYLGGEINMSFITANTAIANTTDEQPRHKDTSFVHPHAPFIAISNFLLDDFKPENGSTEFWLGSHSQTCAVEQMWRSPDSIVPTCDVRPELLEERRKTRPPAQVTVPFGCVLLRDPRCWHAGMPNRSDQDRIMIAVAYSASWYPQDMRFKVPESARALLTSDPKVNPLCDFYPDDEWNGFCQQWGQGEMMDLGYAPFPDRPEGWDPLAMLKPEEKVLNLKFNEHAKG
ncbi:hypothetical protein JCM10207_008319 [Rhodosporidiobolus poonsookiae]